MKNKHVSGQEKQLSDSARSIAFGAERDALIRETAYSLSQAGNGAGDSAEQNWLQAETLVNQMPGKSDASTDNAPTLDGPVR